MDDWMTPNTIDRNSQDTTERLVRMLDEERQDRIEARADRDAAREAHRQAEAQLGFHQQTMLRLRADLADLTVQLRDRDNRIFALEHQNSGWTFFRDEQTMKDTMNRLIWNDLEVRVPEMRKELAEAFNWITVIKDIRERFGLSLKAAKEGVDRFRELVG